MNILEQAKNQLNQGVATFPFDPDGRYTDRPKKPLVRWSEFHKRLPSMREWHNWVKRWPECSIGLVTGYWRNRFVLDFDSLTEFALWSSEYSGWLANYTLVVATARGFHVHFASDLPPGRGFIARHPNGMTVEVKAMGQYVAIPPSVHASGYQYKTVNNSHVLTIHKVEGALGGFVHPQQLKLPEPPSRPKKTLNGSEKYKSRVSAIKANFTIQEFVPAPWKLDPHSGRVGAHCPIPGHSDKHSSFWFHPDDQVCACRKCTQGFGTNGTGGTWDVINLYAAIKGISNQQAIFELANRLGLLEEAQ